MFHFILFALILLIFVIFFIGGITISLTFLEFSSVIGFGIATFSAIFFLIKNPVTWASYGLLFRDQFFQQLGLFVAVSNDCFPYLLDTYFANNKNSYPLIHFVVLVPVIFHKTTCQFYLLKSNVKLILFSIPNGLPFWSANVVIFSSNSVL